MFFYQAGMRQNSTSNGGGLFGGSRSGSKNNPTSARPSTSSGSPSTSQSESTFSPASAKSGPFSRKPSFSSKSPKLTHRRRASNTISGFYPDKRSNSYAIQQVEDNPLPTLTIPKRQESLRRDTELVPQSADSYKQIGSVTTESVQSPISSKDSFTSTTPYVNMLVRPGTSHQPGTNNGQPNFQALQQPPSPTLETITYQHIQETSSKRISTLDYLRKAHEGRVYWFNTLLFNKTDLSRMPYFDTRKLARRATNYLLLGLSLPTVLDLNSSNASEFLKTLNALLAEFESFQQMHPADGSSSSLSRRGFPQMFKRTTTSSKGRRTSSAAEIGLPAGNDADMMNGGSNNASFQISETDLLPGEEYTHLLTPSLPFDPDFYETFATLCDVLIDCYTKLMSLIPSPKECSPSVAEMFTKADARVRKIIVQGVVKEFEDSSRTGVKSEVAGVGRVVLGGLM